MELGLTCEFSRRVMQRVGESFTLQELRASIDAESNQAREGDGILMADHSAAQGIWIASRAPTTRFSFSPEQQLSEANPISRRAITAGNGIEDARFVRFLNDDGSFHYYATFTAYDGRVIMPELVETSDFLRFRFITLNGPAARNKGMALFPRKVNGLYAMLGRQDNESISVMFSDNVHFWNERRVILTPKFPWELIQLGNCGAPIETDAGWLVLSQRRRPHAQVPCIGAFLLDRDDPTKLIGRLREPLLSPDANEREGYVPNVLYTCGALLHQGALIVPYGMADHATGFATIPLNEVLAAMEPGDAQ